MSGWIDKHGNPVEVTMIETTGTYYCPACDESFANEFEEEHRKSHDFEYGTPPRAATAVFLLMCTVTGALAGLIVVQLT